MPRPDTLSLLKLLKVPTFQSPDPLKPVNSFADFFVAIDYTEREFTVFVDTLLRTASEADVSAFGASEEEQAKTRKLLAEAIHDMVSTLMARRARRARLTDNSSRHEPTDNVAKSNIEKLVDTKLEEIWRTSHTLIGPIVLDGSMPVTDVEITENYSAQTTRTLRSSTDTVFKSHKSDIVMAITIQVPANRIDDHGEVPGLYSLLATLKAFPVCEIVSSAITPVYVNSILAPEVFESVRKKVSEEIKKTTGENNRRGEQVNTLLNQSFGTSLENFKNFIGNLNPVIDFVVRPDDMMRKQDGTPAEIQDPAYSMAAERLKNFSGSVSVACAYMGCIVKTSPGRTNELTVKLFFRRFNDKVWSPVGKIFYRDKFGDPTPNAVDCPWITTIAKKIFADGNKNPTNYMRPYWDSSRNGPSGIKFTWLDPMNPDDPLVFWPNGTSWIISDIECRSFMKMVSLPMLGSPYPSAQYMGIDNLHVRISATITDATELARLHEMKASLDQINYSSGAPEKRSHYVSIDNNVLNFLGGYDFVISGITTSRVGEDDVWDVEIELLESNISSEEVEAIILRDESYQEKGDVEIIWKHIFKLLSEKSEYKVSVFQPKRGSNPYAPEYESIDTTGYGYKIYSPHIRNEKVPAGYLDEEGQLAWEIVFGRAGERGSNSVLQPNIMAATWYSLALKHKNDGRTPNVWNTSFRYEPMIAAVMEGRAFDNSFGRLFTNDRTIPDTESGIYMTSFVEASAGSEVRPFSFFVLGSYNPASIFDLVRTDKTVGNTLRESDPESWIEFTGSNGKTLDRVEKEAQARALDWVSKGQYDTDAFSGIASFGPASNNALSESAQTNIFGQGKELLEWMSKGDARRNVFFSKEFWDEYLNIVYGGLVRPDTDKHPAWKNEDILDARIKLASLLREGVFLEFPSLANKKFQTLTARDRYVRTNLSREDANEKDLASKYEVTKSNYADMHLPTYQNVFSENQRLLTDPNTGQELWKKFAPTYSDLGIKPPYLREIAFQSIANAIEKCVRDLNDPIEPYCVYYHFRLKSSALAAFLDEQALRDSHLKAIEAHKQLVVPAEISRNGAGAVDAYLKEVWKLPNDRYMREAFDKRTGHEALRNLGNEGSVKSITVIDEEGAYLGTVTPDTNSRQRIKFNSMPGAAPKIYSGDGNSVVDHYSGIEISKAGKDLLLRTEDRTGSMARIYPAYRLFFIEKDKNFRFLSDDLYGVNSLISLSLRKDKDDADVLVATISNTTDNLSNERVLTPQQLSSLGLLQDDEGDGFFSSLKLQAGVLVQLRMGYGSDPNDLPIVFTGMITEIRPGKIVEITCQGHKRELLNEIQFEMESINHFDIVRKILEKTEHPNLGEPVSAGRVTWTTIASRFPEGQNPYDYVGSSDRWFNKKIVDMSNVYLTSNAPLEAARKVYFDDREGRTGASRIGNGVRNTIQFLSEALPDSWWVDIAYRDGRWAKWVIPPQSAWDAIQEVARHRPGHIAQVVPYDTRGTLFVGQPEQTYQYTEPNHLELLTYSLLQSSLTKQKALVFGEDLINPFLDSFWAKIYSAHFKGWGTASSTKQDLDTNGDIFSQFSDANVFVEPKDIMELDELPDADDKAKVIRKLKDNPGFDALAKKHIARQAKVAELPGSFSIETNWWVYPNDLRPEVAELEKIYPGIIDTLFIWFYDLDPTSARLKFANISNSLRPLFFSSDGPVMKNFKEELLHSSESEFSMTYESVANGSALINNINFVLGQDEKQLDLLVSQGLLTESEAAEVRKNLFSPDKTQPITRHVLEDHVSYYLRIHKEDAFREVLAETAGAFRLFVFNMYMFLTQDMAKEDTSKKVNSVKAANSIRNLMASDLPPGKKVFRAYHHITMGDIIENKIMASMDEMSNCCLVRAPASEVEYSLEKGTDSNGEETEEVIVEFEETDWRSYPSTDGVPYTWKIGKKFRKLGVVYELNAIHPNQKAKTLMSNMGAMLAPMYRGTILIVGRDIKPHDVVYINDTENDLRGHFEVESVVHHYSVATGWVTEITPCALVRVNNPTSELQLASTQSFLSKLQVGMDLLDVGLALFAIAGLFTGGLGTILGAGLKTATKAGAKSLAASAGKAAARNIVAAAVRNYFKAGVSFAGGFARGASSKFVFNLGNAGATAAAANKNKALAMASYVGGLLTPRSVSIYTGLKLLVSAAAVYTSIHTKHIIASTELPVDVHLLLYRGQILQAGLGVEDEDVYSIYDKIVGAVSDIKDDFGDFVEGLADDIAGVHNTSPVERVRRDRENR